MDERYMRDMRGMDGRRLPPRNSRGEFRRRRRGDRGMDYADMRGDMRMRDREMDMMRGDGRVIRSYPTIHPQGDYGDMNYDMARGGRGGRGGRGRGDRGDYGYDMERSGDMREMDYRGDYGDYRGEDMRRGDYGDMRMRDGHHMGGRGGYEPVEFMGYCSGYYGAPQSDYGRGRDYGYGDYRRGDYGYDYGDYGETLSEQELDEWCKKLMSQLDESEKQMFNKDTIMQRAKSMNKPMEGFGEKELYVATIMVYTDYKNSIGKNPDLAIKLAYDWLSDKDVKVKGAQKLAVYFDEIVMGGEDD